MKKTKLILVLALCFAFFNGCSNEEPLIELEENALNPEAKNTNSSAANTQNRSIGPHQTGTGNLIYYKIVFANITASQRTTISQNFSANTQYANDVISSANESVVYWRFYNDDKAFVDQYITDNITNFLLDVSLSPEDQFGTGVINVTYDSTVTPQIEEDIRGDILVDVVIEDTSNNETWILGRCCSTQSTCEEIGGKYIAAEGGNGQISLISLIQF